MSDTKQFRAVIFVNGELTDPESVRAMLRSDDYLIAADGGYQHLRRLGIMPAIVIGDLDSISPDELTRLRVSNVRVEPFPKEKDQTDLELALLHAVQQGASEVRVVAALGGRLDQTLANLYLLEMDELENIDVRLDDGHEEILIIRKQVEIIGKTGDTVSLLAMDGCTHGILTDGLRYPLKEETLCPSRSRGISNEMLTDKASVRVQRGRLLCIHTRQNNPA